MKLQRLMFSLASLGVLAFITSEALSHGPRRPPRPIAGDRVGSLERSAPRSQATTNPIRNQQGVTKGQEDPATKRDAAGRPGVPEPGKTKGKRDQTNRGVGFVPGSEGGSLPWNTTRAVKDRPILVYLFNCEDRKGKGFDFARALETQILRDKEIQKLGRKFVCERICYGSPYFKDKVKGREMLQPWIEEAAKKGEKLQSQLVFLDAKGKVITALEGPRQLKKKGTKGLLADMKKALKENDKRRAAP